LRYFADAEAISLVLASLAALGPEVVAAPAENFAIRDSNVDLTEIDGSQHHRSISLSLLFEELTRCSLLNYLAQPDKLISPLIGLHVTPTVKIVQCRGAIAHRITLP
jgi:hypothetical protein